MSISGSRDEGPARVNGLRTYEGESDGKSDIRGIKRAFLFYQFFHQNSPL